MEGGSLPESCCDQQIARAEKGHPAIPRGSLLFAPVFINIIWIFPHQYEVNLTEHFNNKSLIEKNPINPDLIGNKFPGPEDTHLTAEK